MDFGAAMFFTDYSVIPGRKMSKSVNRDSAPNERDDGARTRLPSPQPL
jgi:hypothetical protein